MNKPDTFWAVEGVGSAQWHDGEPEFDQQSGSFDTYAERWFKHWLGVSANASYGGLFEDYAHLRDTWTLGGSVLLVEKPWTRTRVWYNHSDSRYDATIVIPSQDLDGVTNSVGFSQDALIPGTNLELTLGYSHTFQDTEGRDFDAGFDSVSLQASHPIAWGIRGTAGFSYTHGGYDHHNSFDPLARRRDDDIWVESVRLEKPVTGWMTVFASMTLTANQSNVPLFNEDQNLYYAGVEFRY